MKTEDVRDIIERPSETMATTIVITQQDPDARDVASSFSDREMKRSNTKKARFEPSSRLIRQLHREHDSKECLEQMFSYPIKFSCHLFESEKFREVRAGEKVLVDGEIHTPKCLESQRPVHRSEHVPKLVLKLDSIEFHDHYYFNEEERLCRNLHQAVESFTLLKESGRIQYSCSRLAALLTCMDAKTEVGSNFDLQILFQEIHSTIDDIILSEKDIDSSYSTVLKLWKELMSLRIDQGFQSTRLKLETSTTGNPEDADTLNILKDSMNLLHANSSFLLQSLNNTIKSEFDEELKDILSKGNTIIFTQKNRRTIQLIDGDARYLTSIANYLQEQNRRSCLQTEKYFIRVLLNGHTVYQTKPNHITWPSWTLSIHEEVNCVLSRIPESIKIQLFRHRFILSPELLSEAVIECPGKNLGKMDKRLMMLAPSMMASGFKGNLESKNVAGIINLKICWVESIILNSGFNYMDVGVPPQEAHRLVGKMHDISIKNYHAIPNYSNSEEFSTSYPFLSKYAFSFVMKDTNHLYMNSLRVRAPLRQEMIRMRSQGSITGIDLIPLTEFDIPNELRRQLIHILHDCLGAEDSIITAAKSERAGVSVTAIDSFVRHLVSLRKQSDRKLGPQEYEDIVYDKSYIRSQMPPRDYGLFLESMIFSSHFRLKNKHELQSSPRSHEISKLIISAQKVENLPQRNKLENEISSPNISLYPVINSDIRKDSKAGLSLDVIATKESDRKPRGTLLMFSIEGLKYESREWREQLEIPLNLNLAEMTVSPSIVRSSCNSIYIILFDLADVRIRHHKVLFDGGTDLIKEKRYLGFAEIPIFALHEHSKYVGSGRVILTSPPISFGYMNLKGDHENVSSKTDEEEARCLLHSHQSPVLEIEVSIQPHINFLDQPIRHTSSSADVRALMEFAPTWLKRFHRRNCFSVGRKIDLFARDKKNESYLLTQYLRPQNPPPEFISLSQVAHYVSLIPCLRTWNTFRSDADYLKWITCQQVLDISAGDWEAKGFLLANYFLSIENGNDVFVVFGTSFSDGKVVYVMTRSKNSEGMILWNPENGKSFTEDDHHECPLVNIDFIISRKNIYGNVQAVGKPKNVDFNLEDKSAWMPFFDPKHNPYIPLKSIQDDILVYSDANVEFALQIELEIKEKIKGSIRSWRVVPSKFNSDISERLDLVLADMETRKCNGSCYESSTYYFRTIHDLCLDKEVFGFPLHFAFTNLDEITERVHLTAIHESKHPNVEFALSAKVFPYASNLYSVWIFLCTFTPK